MTHSVWLTEAASSGFGIDNLPYGVFSRDLEAQPRVGVRIGGAVLDVGAMATADGRGDAEELSASTLNPFMALGPAVWRDVREWLTARLSDNAEGIARYLTPLADVKLHLPFAVADFTDFYSSAHHAANVGRIFRPDAEPLLRNWTHLPVGYHGRAGTVVVSGTDVARPMGQQHPVSPGDMPGFGPSVKLDFEAEVGFVVGAASEPGQPVGVGEFAEYVFGVCLVNDWSARDIQAWEYRPLGPFLGKSFATSVSPWIVPLDALGGARCDPPERNHPVLPHLEEREPWALDLQLDVQVNGAVVARPPFAQMYWTPAQQLAHLTSNGAHVRTGDLFASGTVSGPEPAQWGSLLELTWDGRDPIECGDGAQRTYLQDGDTVIVTATAPMPGGGRLSLGEVAGRVTGG